MQNKKQKRKRITKNQVYKMALEKGVKTTHVINVAKPIYKRRNKTKEQLIREIQKAENNNPCFRTITNCAETGCLWYTECQKTK